MVTLDLQNFGEICKEVVTLTHVIILTQTMFFP